MAETGNGSGSGSARQAANRNRSAERAAAILAAFTHDRPWMSLLELSRAVELPKPTVYRLAISLVATGFMSQNSSGEYGLGVKLMELGAIVRENLDLVQQCGPAIDDLSRGTEESVLLATVDWESMEVMIVARRDSAHPLSVLSPEGRRQPLPPGALGKALISGLDPEESARLLKGHRFKPRPAPHRFERDRFLADVERARELGYAIEEEEYVEGVSAVATPVVYDDGRPLAALGVAGPSGRLQGRLDEIGSLLVAATSGLRPAASPGGRKAEARQSSR